MLFQLREIVLWSRDATRSPRRLRFELGKLNVITGASKTGKSAIIPIIDYCLGSDRCSVPVATIRDACAWFGIVVETQGRQRLLARREPGAQKSTGDMFVLEGPDIDVPRMITQRNTNVEAVKESLNELAGLSQLQFDAGESSSGFRGRPSFRDLVAFMFQPQNIVANPEVLFYKADTYEHREKLRTVFPYVLGAITPSSLARQHELAELRADLRRKERELAVLRETSQRWLADVQTRIATARELGLLASPPSPGATAQQLVATLRTVLDQAQPETHISPLTISGAAVEAVELENEEATVSADLVFLKHRFEEMTRLRETVVHYGQALQIKRDRLNISGWIRGLYDDDHVCPICGARNDLAEAGLDELVLALQDTERQIGDFESVPAAFDREYERVRAEIARATERLDAIKIRRAALHSSSEEIRRRQYVSNAAVRFVGGLEEALTRFDSLTNDSVAVLEVADLRERVTRLETQLREQDIRAAIDRALRRVSSYAGRILPQLDAERPYDPIALLIDDLTLKVTGVGREDYLWEIGSGANWLSYHVAVSLALHDLFLEQTDNPVPGLIVYDQPSQVYFPRRLAGTVVENIDVDPRLGDEDVEAVRKLFEALSRWVAGHQNRAQAIVLDHASDDVWGDIANVHKVEEWRFGLKLIPSDWPR